MFESLTDRLGGALKSISGQSKLTEENIKGTVREVRIHLKKVGTIPMYLPLLNFALVAVKIVNYKR